MCNSIDHHDGQCSICGDKTKVRYKNIWLIGSEGIDVCMPCEKHMVKYLEDRKRHFVRQKLEKLRDKARRKHSIFKKDK